MVVLSHCRASARPDARPPRRPRHAVRFLAPPPRPTMPAATRRRRSSRAFAFTDAPCAEETLPMTTTRSRSTRATPSTTSRPRGPGRLLRPGQMMRLIDIEGQQALDALFYNAADPAERYSAQDTMRVNGTPYLGLGTTLVSNEGRAMATLVADTCGRHDTLGRLLLVREQRRPLRRGDQVPARLPRELRARARAARPGQARPRAQRQLLHERADRPDRRVHGRRRRLGAGQPRRPAAEMDVLCVFSNCPQVNNPCNGFDPTPVRVLVGIRRQHDGFELMVPAAGLEPARPSRASRF